MIDHGCSFEVNLIVDPAWYESLAQLMSATEPLPHRMATLHVPLPVRRLSPGSNASDVPLGEWSIFEVGIENEQPLVQKPMRLERYQPQDGDGPGWVEYGLWSPGGAL